MKYPASAMCTVHCVCVCVCVWGGGGGWGGLPPAPLATSLGKQYLVRGAIVFKKCQNVIS